MSQRTSTQNKALWKYFELLAEELNNAGLEMRVALPQLRQTDVPWSKELIKEALWKPLQEAMLKKQSTTELTTSEVDKVYKVLDRHLAEKLGVSVKFPSSEPDLY